MTTYWIEPDAPDSGSETAAGEPEGQPGQWRLVFDFYMGQQIVTDVKDYAVTDSLKDSFQAAGITGADFKPMAVARGDQFDLVSPGVVLPRFWQLHVVGRQGVDDLWIVGMTGLHVSQKALDVIRASGDETRAHRDDVPRPEWTPSDGRLL